MTVPSVLQLCPELAFKVGQRVIERYAGPNGLIDEDVPGEEVEIMLREGPNVVTESGRSYDAMTGAAVPRGKVYSGIRSVTNDDRKKAQKAQDLLGGTSPSKKP